MSPRCADIRGYLFRAIVLIHRPDRGSIRKSYRPYDREANRGRNRALRSVFSSCSFSRRSFVGAPFHRPYGNVPVPISGTSNGLLGSPTTLISKSASNAPKAFAVNSTV